MGRQRNIKGANQKEDVKRQKTYKNLFALFSPTSHLQSFPFCVSIAFSSSCQRVCLLMDSSCKASFICLFFFHHVIFLRLSVRRCIFNTPVFFLYYRFTATPFLRWKRLEQHIFQASLIAIVHAFLSLDSALTSLNSKRNWLPVLWALRDRWKEKWMGNFSQAPFQCYSECDF